MKACIFNLSGVLVDKFYIMNTRCLYKTFDKYKYVVPHDIYNKFAHYDTKNTIQNILMEDTLLNQWFLKNKKYPELEYDSDKLKNCFNDIINIDMQDNLKIEYDVKQTINYLKSENFKIGLTSNYNYTITNSIVDKLKYNNIDIDYFSCSDYFELSSKPYQIYDNIINLNIENIQNVFYVDNSLEGLKRGLKSGCKTISVVHGSPLMNIYTNNMLDRYDILFGDHPNGFHSIGNYNRYLNEYDEKIVNTKKIFNEIGCADTLDVLPDLRYIV